MNAYRLRNYVFTPELNRRAVAWFEETVCDCAYEKFDFVVTGVFAAHTERLEYCIRQALNFGYDVYIKTLTSDFGNVHNVPRAHLEAMKADFVPEKELKVGIVNANMIADYVILDARLIKNLPRKIAAATGVDALAHAIECYTSKKANPFSDTFAMEALDLILNNIIPACDDPEAMDAKNKMQIAAFYAGIAITASGTTAVHALSYPLGGKYHIAHGVSNAILLAPVMRFNAPYCQERLAAAYDRCCHDEVKTCRTAEEKTAWVISTLEHIVKHLEIPTSLQEFGVPAEDIDGLVEAGMQVQRLLVNNMRPVTPEDARKLYLEIL